MGWDEFEAQFRTTLNQHLKGLSRLLGATPDRPSKQKQHKSTFDMPKHKTLSEDEMDTVARYSFAGCGVAIMLSIFIALCGQFATEAIMSGYETIFHRAKTPPQVEV